MRVGIIRLTKPSAIARIEQLLRRVCGAAVYLAIAMLATMTALVAAQVACRNLLDLGLPWADEFARYTGLWVVYLTVPLLLLESKHIAVDMLVARLTGRLQILARLASEFCVIAFCVLLLISLASFLQRAAKFVTPAVGMPNWAFYMPVVVGFVLLTLVALHLVLRTLRHGLSG